MARDIDRTAEFVWRFVRGGLNRKGGGAWVETPVPDSPGWYAACLLLRVGDGVTLAELRIFPNAGRWVPSGPAHPAVPSPGGKYAVGLQVRGRPGKGDWSRRPSDLLPEQLGGITSRMLRKVPLDAIFTEALRVLNTRSRLPRGWDSLDRNTPGRPGRAGRDDRFYAVWAQRYVEQASKSRSPTRDLANIHGEHYGAIVQIIHDARERGLLSRAEGGQQGRRGGALTAKALKLLLRPGKAGKPQAATDTKAKPRRRSG